MPGFAHTSAMNLAEAIFQARYNVELPHFIKALCIPGIGKDVGKKLADHFGSLRDMAQERALQGSNDAFIHNVLLKIDGIGLVAAETIASKEFWDAVDDLSDYLKIAPYKKTETSAGKLAGKVFVLTGKMEHPRSYYVAKIEAAGGKESSAVNSKTDFVVYGDKPGSKLRKAQEKGIKIITEHDLMEMLK